MRSRLGTIRWVSLLALLATVALLPSAGAYQGASVADSAVNRVSQSVVTRYYAANPGEAPLALKRSIRAMRLAEVRKKAGLNIDSRAAAAVAGVGFRFNQDGTGLPQNEESVTACSSAGDAQQAAPNVVLGGTNDYRGLIDPPGNFTGWHLSLDGGRSLAREGRLPPVGIRGTSQPSGGDPVVSALADCTLYAASLNYDPQNPFGGPNGIGVYRSTPATLRGCAGGDAASCWPRRRAVVANEPGHFLDKEWMYAGRSGAAGNVVWVTYTDFAGIDTPDPTDDTSIIEAVRCSADLSTCTAPIRISQSTDTQFSDVTIGPDGRVYVTWTEVTEARNGAQTFTHRLRVAQAGSTTFGPIRTVVAEANAFPFGGKHQGNDFRDATYPVSDVRIVNGRPRVFVVWDGCEFRPLGFVCEDDTIKLRFSDDLGATWSATRVISAGGVNYMPTIHSDRSGSRIAVAYFTNRFDPTFENRQDVELVSISPTTGAPVARDRITAVSNESEADPLLGGLFIGDYIEVFAFNGTAYVHYNANYTRVRLLGEGEPIPQQDNYLIRRALR